MQPHVLCRGPDVGGNAFNTKRRSECSELVAKKRPLQGFICWARDRPHRHKRRAVKATAFLVEETPISGQKPNTWTCRSPFRPI